MLETLTANQATPAGYRQRLVGDHRGGGLYRPCFSGGSPQPLFNTEMVDTSIRTGPISWDIAPDGKRFLIIADKSLGTSSLNVILNWHPEDQK